ncbi:XTP/dITP diphosphohydrolase [Pedococcus dokdonensis]|uniref:XTP/dITP diphosphohydrolase n=1 Tax=Pedococcus dokdonensis TaxID=443156 RepID=A0A1H0S8W8_9MICO|nr:MazG family protein [Pedococcus dokdonensis]SDP37636.1 XTP/dITP diphosphohydrolase [Pedococcus dokdonensis]
MAGRLTLLVGSPRIAPGLFTRAAWQALDEADAVLARDDSEPLALAVDEAGVPVGHLGDLSAPSLARTLMDRAAGGSLVWVASADGDPGLTDAIASEVSRLGSPPDVEVLVASWDVPGSRLLDLVAVMDRLRSPGGCPWDAEQTHESLVKYLIEESHEAAEAIESGDRDHIREELGDVLLQVVFQARVAQEHGTEPFDVDDVAGAIVEKLVRRHPHVFADGDASTPAEVERAWEQIKADERAAKAAQAPHGGGEDGHQGLLHGIPRSLPSLLAADKVLARWERTGRGALPEGEGYGAELLALLARARADGVDVDAELRRALRALDSH